jgi:uncharacterized membrane protein
MIHTSTLLAILLMALTTYLTRVVGYVGLRDRALGPRAMAVLEAAPGCVLIAVIAPSFVADRPADLMAWRSRWRRRPACHSSRPS